MNRMHTLPMHLPRILATAEWNGPAALREPCNNRRDVYAVRSVTMVVYCCHSLSTHSCQYPLERSSFPKNLAPATKDANVSWLGIGVTVGLVTELIACMSMVQRSGASGDTPTRLTGYAGDPRVALGL